MPWTHIQAGVVKLNERMPGKPEQLLGTRKIYEDEYFFLGDEVGCGKTKQEVDATQLLYQAHELDTVLVVTWAAYKSTWLDPDPLTGEVAKHAWKDVPNSVFDYGSDNDEVDWTSGHLNWCVTNYEFIRREERLKPLLLALAGRKVQLVCDESWALKGNSDQMKAVRNIRKTRASRVLMMNGTPLDDGKPEDMYYQLQIMSPSILQVNNRQHFRSRYCIMGGFKGKQVVGHQNLDDFNRRIAPHVLARKTREVWPDLPPMNAPITVPAPMSDRTWSYYVQMRDDMVVWLKSGASTASQAIVKGLRLAQLCSGYLGGVDEDLADQGEPAPPEPIPGWLLDQADLAQDATEVKAQAKQLPPDAKRVGTTLDGLGVYEIGDEKLQAFLRWLEKIDPADRPKKLLVWCRFRAELERTALALERFYPVVHKIKGGQKKAERQAAKRFLAPGNDPNALGACVANQKAGGASLNLSGAWMSVYMSNGPALIDRTQSVGRIERPGQRHAQQLVDMVATGPKGQKTFDHNVIKALRGKLDMATWTVAEWRRLLAESES